jgi:hypothetical protein
MDHEFVALVPVAVVVGRMALAPCREERNVFRAPSAIYVYKESERERKK